MDWHWQRGGVTIWAIVTGVELAVGLTNFASSVWGQPIPDNTLGGERSRVIDRSPRDFEIDGGARRGANLFHSFQEFNVDEGGSVYFLNPDGVRNILSRVTGQNRSEILGTLGVLGNANLFLLNPNGILFGPNAQLDLGGSFVATTANAFQFSDQGVFSATNPTSPTLLTVNPSAFLFNQIPAGSITNTSVAPAGPSFLGLSLFGLRVPDNHSLLLVGGDITMDQGRLNATDGRIELGGLAAAGSIGLTTNGNLLSLQFPTTGLRSDVTLTNDARAVGSGMGAEIVVNANRFTATNGGRLANLIERSGSPGRLIVNANEFRASGIGLDGLSSGLYQDVFPTVSTNAGNVIVNANTLTLESGGSITSKVLNGSTGNAGAIDITAGDVSLSDALLASLVFGQGNAGPIAVRATGTVGLSNSQISSSVQEGGSGGSSNVDVQARTLNLANSSGIRSSSNNLLASDSGNSGDVTIAVDTLNQNNSLIITNSIRGQGRAGNLTISATDALNLLNGSSLGAISLGAQSDPTAPAAGNIEINTGRLTVQNSSIAASTFLGQGRAGNLTIRASDSIDLDDSSVGTTAFGTGAGGDTLIETNQLRVRQGSVIGTNNFDINLLSPAVLANYGFTPEQIDFFTSLRDQYSTGDPNNPVDPNSGEFGQQNSGNLTIRADQSIDLGGLSANGKTSSLNTGTFGGGNAGTLQIETGQLTVRDGASIESSTLGRGRGGNLSITADAIELAGVTTTTGGSFRSTLSTQTEGAGNAGNLTINTRQFTIRDGASVTASTYDSGQGGAIKVTADQIEISGLSPDRQFISFLGSDTSSDATGDAGNVSVSTRQLTLQGGAEISTSTFGVGQGGNLNIHSRDGITLTGTNTFSNGQIVSSGLFSFTDDTGNAGNVQVVTDDLQIRAGATILASTFGTGRGGTVRIRANSIDLAGTSPDRSIISGIASETYATEAGGDAGNITVNTRQLTVRNGARISTSTFGQGNAGDIAIQSRDRTRLLHSSTISSSVGSGATGNSGDIRLRTNSLSVARGSQIAAVVSRQSRDAEGNLIAGGQGTGGDIDILADLLTLSGIDERGYSSGILTLSERGATGSAGDIDIQAGDFRVDNGAIVTASTFNQGRAGNIEINTDRFEAANGGQVVTNTRSQGRAGTITLNAANQVELSGRDPNFAERQRVVNQFIRRFSPSDRPSDLIINQGASSGLFANTESRSTGNGGSVRVNTENLSLSDRATISARSQGGGRAGAITIAADQLNVADSDIVTAAQQSSGGAITVTGGDVRLRGESDIRTSVAQGAGGGGNITVNGDSLVAFDDSDIIAAAIDGRGGDINFGETIAFFENYNPNAANANADTLEGNDRADVNATGAQPGTIQFPDTSLIQNSLSDLPENAVDADQLIANSCIARTKAGGTFLITGADGLAERPGDAQHSNFPTGEIRAVPVNPDAEIQNHSWQPGNPIVEPQAAYRLPNGQIVLSRECDSNVEF